MLIGDFKFRIVKKGNCHCGCPFIYGNEALARLGEFIDTDARIELWSGFYDYKGNKIYEGDIIQCREGIRVLVGFEQGIFCTKVADMRASLAVHLNISERPKVIGNIHENADLLNCEKSENKE